MTLTPSRMRPRLLLQIGGWALLASGLLTMGYATWAYREVRSYLEEVEASGQVVETFDAVNYLMSGSGLYLLLGVLLAAHGGVCLALRRVVPEKPELPVTGDRPVPDTDPGATPPVQRREDGSAPTEEEELEALLRRVDDTP
ncbi:hypothetical protein [Nesterenkonia sp. DZ6]|uniref:hypothetical protein n=1 Tax=Nesterenkonia sp. DZ6 TaxID=2901229 RepID=UPI001F4C8DE4|nr:hypothetical protein [Nesterenkonia sp. DZ6]MCH8560754.1 hypothetical protein [Nesterenkonia sp. DZ6]